jgi:oxygen tolerance protein BatD
MKQLIAFWGFILVFLCGPLQAQDVSFVASAQSVVQLGQRFSLTFSINANGSKFDAPALDGFRILSGPNTSSSSSVQYVNGKRTRSTNNTYTYYLQAAKEGTFNIKPASISVKGKKHQSNAVKIKVVKASANAQQQNQNTTNPKQQNNQQNKTGISDEDIYIKAIVDKSNPYLGEQILVSYKIYTRVSTRAPVISKAPSFPGFWSINLSEQAQQLQQQREIINGSEYITAIIYHVALFPQKSGTLEIEPMEVECQIQVQSQSRRRSSNSLFDRFFEDPFGGINYVQKNLKANTLKINVKPLPTTNRPANFNGAVGTFSIKSTIDKSTIKTNEALTLKVSVSGKGNFDLIDNFKINFPPDFEVYDPKIRSKINKGLNGISGTKYFEYLVIPRTPGDFTIPPLEFSYFNLNTSRYANLKTQEYKINVAKGESNYSSVQYSGVSQEDVKYIGSDIRHIQTGNHKLQQTASFLYNSLTFYLLLIVPLFVAIVFVLIWKSKAKQRSNVSLMNNKKAMKVARKNLKKAFQFLKSENDVDFYTEVYRAMWGFLSNKFNISRSKLSIENVDQELTGKGIKKEIIDQFIQTLNNTEFARFAPGNKSMVREKIYNEALEIISKIERELR